MPEIDAAAGTAKPKAIVSMHAPIPTNDRRRRSFLPVFSIKEAAPIVPRTLITPTAAEARASDWIPADLNTAVEKYTIALIPENCWIKNSTIPMRAPLDENASLQDIFSEESPLGETGLSGQALIPRPSNTAGTAASIIIVLQDVAGINTLTMRAARMPMHIIS
jgi:hypothetical protein